MADRSGLQARGPFEDLLQPIGSGCSVVVGERRDLQIATIIARAGPPDALREKLRAALKVELPDGPKKCSSGEVALLGIGPRTWLALSTAGQPPLAESLETALGALAAVADQSDGYAVLRIGGEKCRAMLEKGLAIDLHSEAFRIDDVASTTCAHIGVTIWRIDESPTYEIAMYRSYARSFCCWLSESAAEFGLAAISPASHR